MKKWILLLVPLLLVPLLIGCGGGDEEGIIAPEIPAVEDGVDVDKEDPPGLCVFAQHEEASADTLPHDNLEPVFIVPRYGEIVMQWLLGLKHCEDHGLGIDHGLGPSPPGEQDGGGSAGGGGGGAD